jgi:hypothetical protein
MHLSGLMRRQRRPLEVMHISQVLVGRALPSAPLLPRTEPG